MSGLCALFDVEWSSNDKYFSFKPSEKQLLFNFVHLSGPKQVVGDICREKNTCCYQHKNIRKHKESWKRGIPHEGFHLSEWVSEREREVLNEHNLSVIAPLNQWPSLSIANIFVTISSNDMIQQLYFPSFYTWT